MEINNLHDLVFNYYRRIFFLFVPNICNCKCSFCYTKPRFSKYATLNNSILNRIDKFVNIAKNIGFNEFRITGGEPLLFKNISELFSIFIKNNVTYTLLTNGLNIHINFDLLNENRPNKITISYHSKKYYNNIFGIEYNTDLLDENIRELCRMGINLTVSILFIEKNKNEILSHIVHLKTLGVKSIKLIYPNNEKIKMNLRNDFFESLKLLTSVVGMDIRYSELNKSMCSMASRGFLSFHISQNKIYGCCNSIINKNFISNVNSFESLITTIWNFYFTAQTLEWFPCESHVEFCPIALNE